MAKLLAHYKNGNYDVILLEDGTKIRYNKLDNLTPSFAESIDCTITTKCDGGCEYCYLECNECGVHADLSQPFFNTLHAGQELALNGNDMSHPELIPFLHRMKERGVICNITLNQKHFIKYTNDLWTLYNYGYIHGIGVSLTNSNSLEFYNAISHFPNAVVHVIDGLLTKEDIDNMYDKNIKLLILGYKRIGRGVGYFDSHELDIDNNVKYLRDNIEEISKHFEVVSFDNLSLQHLDMKSKLSEKEWDALYMGDEGRYTFFIDAVNKKFAVSSLTEKKYDLMDGVDGMFRKVKEIADKN